MFSNQIQAVESPDSICQELIGSDQSTEKSTQTKCPKFIPFDLNEDTESVKIRSKLNDFHQTIEQMYKIILGYRISGDNQLSQAKLSHLELKLNRMKEEILVLLYTNPKARVFRQKLTIFTDLRVVGKNVKLDRFSWGVLSWKYIFSDGKNRLKPMTVRLRRNFHSEGHLLWLIWTVHFGHDLEIVVYISMMLAS